MKWYWWAIIIIIILLIVGRYFIAGKGNKSLICPSTFGFGWDKNCVSVMGYSIIDNDTIVNNSTNEVVNRQRPTSCPKGYTLNKGHCVCTGCGNPPA